MTVLMILLYFQHHFLQTVFFEKIDASQLTDQLTEFVSQLQRIGVTLQAYNGAYNNTGHPSAADAQAQFVQNCGPPPRKKKKTADGHQGDETVSTSTSEQ